MKKIVLIIIVLGLIIGGVVPAKAQRNLPPQPPVNPEEGPAVVYGWWQGDLWFWLVDAPPWAHDLSFFMHFTDYVSSWSVGSEPGEGTYFVGFSSGGNGWWRVPRAEVRKACAFRIFQGYIGGNVPTNLPWDSPWCREFLPKVDNWR